MQRFRLQLQSLVRFQGFEFSQVITEAKSLIPTNFRVEVRASATGTTLHGGFPKFSLNRPTFPSISQANHSVMDWLGKSREK